MLFRSVLLAGSLLAGAAQAQAQAHAHAHAQAQPTLACAPGVAAPLPPELAAWSARAPLAAATSVAGLPKAVLAPGRAYEASLVSGVNYAAAPEKPAGADGRGGLFSLKVETAGAYVVALGAGAWIDVLKDGVAQRTAAHGHGPACSTVRKMVTFDLAPGDYVVQISASAEATLPILVARKP